MTQPVTWTDAAAGACLREPAAADDKYARGVLGVRTGSTQYPGAAVLGVEGAWRTGIGLVRYLGPDRARDLVVRRRPETVTVDGRVQAWVIGSGTDASARTAAETAALRVILDGTVPVVVDAGALDLADGAAAPCVLTPHAREHAALYAKARSDRAGSAANDHHPPADDDNPAADDDHPPADDDNPPADDDEPARISAAVATARMLAATVLLKGAVTIVATPSGWVARADAGVPWLATAGTGDVLAGALGALVAAASARAQAAGSRLEVEHLGPIAVTAAWLHGRAGAIAAMRAGAGAGDGPITALDVAAALPQAVAQALAAASGS